MINPEKTPEFKPEELCSIRPADESTQLFDFKDIPLVVINLNTGEQKEHLIHIEGKEQLEALENKCIALNYSDISPNLYLYEGMVSCPSNFCG